jgi:hypothetical protein
MIGRLSFPLFGGTRKEALVVFIISGLGGRIRGDRASCSITSRPTFPGLEEDVDGWLIHPLSGVDMETGLACVKSFAPIPLFERALLAFPLYGGEWVVNGVGAIQSRGRLRPFWNRLLILPLGSFGRRVSNSNPSLPFNLSSTLPIRNFFVPLLY